MPEPLEVSFPRSAAPAHGAACARLPPSRQTLPAPSVAPQPSGPSARGPGLPHSERFPHGRSPRPPPPPHRAAPRPPPPPPLTEGARAASAAFPLFPHGGRSRRHKRSPLSGTRPPRPAPHTHTHGPGGGATALSRPPPAKVSPARRARALLWPTPEPCRRPPAPLLSQAAITDVIKAHPAAAPSPPLPPRRLPTAAFRSDRARYERREGEERAARPRPALPGETAPGAGCARAERRGWGGARVLHNHTPHTS